MEVEKKDECFEIFCDEQYQDIVRRQINIISDMDKKLRDIRANLRSKKVEETLESLALLDNSVKDERKEMMKMLEKDIRYMEEYKDENERHFNESMTLRCQDHQLWVGIEFYIAKTPSRHVK